MTVQLHRTGDELQFSVRDTGCGFDPRTATRGQGLASLHDRVDTVGGHIDVEVGTGSRHDRVGHGSMAAAHQRRII